MSLRKIFEDEMVLALAPAYEELLRVHYAWQEQ
jgi:hypothetical protein